MVEATLKYLNESIRKDKNERKQRGLVIKEKDRPREIYTELGRIRWRGCGQGDRVEINSDLHKRVRQLPDYIHVYQ